MIDFAVRPKLKLLMSHASLVNESVTVPREPDPSPAQSGGVVVRYGASR